MKKKDIILLLIIVIIAGALVFVFLFFANREVVSNDANLLVKSSNSETAKEVEVLLNNNATSVNVNKEENSQSIIFENFFKAAYLAKFTGSSNLPVTDTFNINDKMVLSVRVATNLQTDLKMKVKIYNGSQEISATPEIDILVGEVGLNNPGKKGDYEARLSVNNVVVGTYSFTIE